MFKRLIVVLVAAMLAVPCIAKASDIEEFELDNGSTNSTKMSTEAMPKASVAKPSSNITTTAPAAAKKAKPAATATTMPAPKKTTAQTVAVKPANEKKAAAKKAQPASSPKPAEHYSSSALYNGREHRFQVSLVGPGFGVISNGVGPLMTIGAEGEYYFWEHLSVDFRIEAFTEFKNSIMSIMPRLRYVYDFDSHPRWSVYGQGGVGLGLYNGKHAAADISIAGGGVSWKWTDHWSVSGETNIHIFAGYGDTSFGWTIGPAFRYLF